MGEQVQRWTPGPWPAAGDGGGYSVATLCVLSCSVIHETLRTTANICPWDSPGKKTRVGCHALLQGILPIQGSNPCLSCLLHWQAGSLPLVPPGGPSVSESVSHSVVSNSLRPYGLYITPGSSVHGILQARVLQWVDIPFSRGSFRPRSCTWVLLHCRQILYHLSHQGSPSMCGQIFRCFSQQGAHNCKV